KARRRKPIRDHTDRDPPRLDRAVAAPRRSIRLIARDLRRRQSALSPIGPSSQTVRIIHERSGGGGGRARHDTAVLATAVNTSVCAAGAPSLARTLAKTAVSRHTLGDGVPFMNNAGYPQRRPEWRLVDDAPIPLPPATVASDRTFCIRAVARSMAPVRATCIRAQLERRRFRLRQPPHPTPDAAVRTIRAPAGQ